MRTGTELRLELNQKLTMTPELRQALSLLMLPQQELLAKVEAECLENPLLEFQEDGSDNTVLAAALRSLSESVPEKNAVDADERETREPLKTTCQGGGTLAEYLREQLFGRKIEAPLANLCDRLIDYLDEDGYLRETDAELSVCLGCSAEQASRSRLLLQQFDPEGLAAQTLEACLLLQVSEEDGLVRQIIARSLADVAAGRWAELARRHHATPAEVQDAVDFIRTLNPRPGRGFTGADAVSYLYPDAVVRKMDGRWITLMRERIPALRINQYYLPLLSEGETEVRHYLGDYYKRALFFMRSLEKRRQSMSLVTDAIVAAQQDFFERGRLFLQPLTLQVVADRTSLSVSTVSRVVSGKYLGTPQGLLPYKAFFSNAANKDTGKEVSTQAVRQQLAALIAAENPKKPLSDQALMDKLSEQGLMVARRTVAKYREQLGIPAAGARRRI